MDARVNIRSGLDRIGWRSSMTGEHGGVLQFFFFIFTRCLSVFEFGRLPCYWSRANEKELNRTMQAVTNFL